jgi:hypothetical protein
MAVTVRNYTITGSWNTSNVLTTLETALADVGYHAPVISGSVLTFTNTAGTTIATKKNERYLVKQSATSGVGRYSTWDISRSNTGAVAAVTLVNGGENYLAANTITIAGADIGGTTPTDNITVTVSTVAAAQGSTTTYFDKDTASPFTWGVCCVNNDVTKELGQTFYAFSMAAIVTTANQPILYIRAGGGFQSTTNVFLGVASLDFVTANAVNSITQQNFSQVIATSNTVPLTLTTYQSGIDSNFVVFQFSESGRYGKIVRNPFFLSKYDQTATQPWDLDSCFTGGIYEIAKTMVANTSDAQIAIQTPTAPMAKRQGEWGYGALQGTFANGRFLIGLYESNWGKRYLGANTTVPSIYERTRNDLTQIGLEYNPVITNLPICNTMVPVPYYIPADFGITEVLGTNSVDYEDTITSGGNTYRVIQYANNQALPTYNSSITFVAQTA